MVDMVIIRIGQVFVDINEFQFDVDESSLVITGRPRSTPYSVHTPFGMHNGNFQGWIMYDILHANPRFDISELMKSITRPTRYIQILSYSK